MTASSSTQQLPTNPTLLCDKYISSFYYDSQTSTLSIRPLFHKGSSGDALNLLAVEKEYILHDDDSNSKDSSVLLGRQMKKMRLFRVPSHLRCPNCNREIASVDIKEHSELCRYDIEPLPYPTINSNEKYYFMINNIIKFEFALILYCILLRSLLLTLYQALYLLHFLKLIQIIIMQCTNLKQFLLIITKSSLI